MVQQFIDWEYIHIYTHIRYGTAILPKLKISFNIIVFICEEFLYYTNYFLKYDQSFINCCFNLEIILQNY